MSEEDYTQGEEELEERAEMKSPFMKAFPKKHFSSNLPYVRFDVKVPSTGFKGIDIMGVKLPDSSIYDTTPKKIHLPDSSKLLKKRY
jgi:hypothetical protein